MTTEPPTSGYAQAITTYCSNCICICGHYGTSAATDSCIYSCVKHTRICRRARTTAVPYTRASDVTEIIEKTSQTATKSKSRQFPCTNVFINNMNALRRRRNQMFVLHSCSSCSKQWRSSLRSAHRHWSVSWPGGMRITCRSADGLRSAEYDISIFNIILGFRKTDDRKSTACQWDYGVTSS